MASMPQLKDIESQIGLKNKTQPYVDYKSLILLKKINTGLESKGRKSFHANGPHKQAIIISEKVGIRLKSTRRDDESHFILMKGTSH
jgi:hypothetical protein